MRSRTVTRPAMAAPEAPLHRDKMLAYVIKADTPESRQIVDPFAQFYAEGNAIEPPVDPERLLLLADESAPHGACLDAKADDTVGRGWTLEPTGKVRDDTDLAPDNDADEPALGATTPDSETDATVGGNDVEDAIATLEETLEAITPDYSFAEILWATAWEMDAIGWGSIEVVNDATGKLGAIYPLPAHTLRATKDRDVFVQSVQGQLRYFARFGSGKKVNGRTGASVTAADAGMRGDPGNDDLATEVLVVRRYSARSPWYGVPRWITAVPAIAELVAIREFNVSFYSSGGMVDRIIHATASEETEAHDLADTIDKAIEEASGSAHVTIVTGGTTGSEVKAVFLTPTQGRRDGQMGNRRTELLDEVLMAHKVPPYRVARAVVGSLGGAPTREMLHSYRVGTIEPNQGTLEHRLNATLFGPKAIELKGFRWKLEDLDYDETELDLKVAHDSVEVGIASPREGRGMLGLDESIEDASLDGFYYKGAPLGSPRPSAGGFGEARASLSALDEFRVGARKRLEERVAARAGSSSGNGRH